MRDNENKKRYLNGVAEKISDNKMKSEIAVELDTHIDERAQFYEEIGYSEEEAFEKAVEQMGDADAVGVSLARLHPKGKAWVSVLLSVGLFILLILAWDFCFLFTVPNGTVGSALCENILLLCFVGISRFGYKSSNVFLSCLSPIAFFLTYGLYVWFFYRSNMQYTEFATLCSPSVLSIFYVCAGDFSNLQLIPYVGGVTVASWLTYVSVMCYILILILLIAVACSTSTLEAPPYSLADKRWGKRLFYIEKSVCVFLVFMIIASVIMWKCEDRKISKGVKAQFNYVVVLQSDTPCSLEDLQSEDCLFFSLHYDLVGDYISYWAYDSQEENKMHTDSKFLTFFCNTSVRYQVQKYTLECSVDKPYVSVMFVKSDHIHIDDFDYVRRFLPETLDWQESASVGTISETVDAYNCVDVIINTEA